MTAERCWVSIFCLGAAIRVFVFAAAFPFFNNVDERAHVDIVFKYANGDFPRGLPHFSSDAVRYLWLFASPEYFMDPTQSGSVEFTTPFWKLPSEQIVDLSEQMEARLKERINHEASDPPLYYAVTGLWLRLGRWCGLENGWLLYWIRFLNVPIAAALVWVAFHAARTIFPDRLPLRMAVPMLVAFFPQDNIYSVQSDAWSPLFYGLAFVGVLSMIENKLSILRSALAGLALSAACLTKVVNLPLLGIVGVFLLMAMNRQFRAGRLRARLAEFLAFGACALVPVAAWAIWNRYAFGDLTGTTAKIQYLGWTAKPTGGWWSHPIFSGTGLTEFWSQLMARFWRGELIWKTQPLASPVMDFAYWISTTLVLAIVLIVLIGRFDLSDFQRRALWLSFFSFIALVMFLAGLSMAFDFGRCFYPSHEHPFFTSGRLLSAAMIPFLLIFAYALDLLTRWRKQRWLSILPAVVWVALCTSSEVWVNWPVFGSPYNFFHLWR
jgi:hypothetical protein